MGGIERDGDVFTGPWRRPVNISADAKGSIHDDATAQGLGLRGGTVAGSIHMEQYPPLLIEAFGPDWLRRGGISLYFRHATTDGEPVRAHVRRDGATRASLRMETEAGVTVNEGTASLGPDPDSALARRLREVRPATDLRILAKARVGATVEGVPSRDLSARLDRHLATITERIAPYDDPSVYGGRVLPPNLAIDALRAVEPALVPVEGPFVGLYGAIELRMLAGPLLAGRAYVARGRVLALEESPKTEGVWYESTLTDGSTDEDVATMIMFSRLMKASSPLWAA